MDKNFTREWQKGDIYAPHDLSAAEARKWRKRHTPTIDAFDALSLNPLDFYKVRLPIQLWPGRGIDIGL
jgi:small subunit ribosomal protein S18